VFDRLGREFTLVRTTGDAAPFVAAAGRLGVPLTVLDLEEPILHDEPRGMVLVRPDLYVGWSGHSAPADVDALFEALTGTRVPSPSLSATVT